MLNALVWALACFGVVAADIVLSMVLFSVLDRVGADGFPDRQPRYSMVSSRRSDGVVFDGAAMVALFVAAVVYRALAR